MVSVFPPQTFYKICFFLKFERIKGGFPLEMEIFIIFEYHGSSLEVIYVTVKEDIGIVLTGILF